VSGHLTEYFMIDHFNIKTLDHQDFSRLFFAFRFPCVVD